MAQLENKHIIGCSGVLIGLILLSTTAIFVERAFKYRAGYFELVDETTALRKQVASTDNRNLSLNQTISLLDGEVTQLNALLAEVHVPKAEVKYIIKHTTKLVPVDKPVIVYKDIPDHHVFTLEGDIDVAEFWNKPEGYKFQTYELSIRNTLVVSPDRSAVLTEVSSSADGVWHPVATELTTVHVEQARYPRIGIQAALGAGYNSNHISVVPGVTLSMPWLHLTEGLDILTPGLTVSPYSYTSLNLVDYKIGKPLPGNLDLWFSAGPTLDIDGKLGVGMSLTTKL